MDLEDKAAFTNAELWHDVCEANFSRLTKFETPIEQAVNPENVLAQRINKKTKSPGPLTLKINGLVYHIYKERGRVYAWSGFSKPIYLGDTEKEVRTSIKEMKRNCQFKEEEI